MDGLSLIFSSSLSPLQCWPCPAGRLSALSPQLPLLLPLTSPPLLFYLTICCVHCAPPSISGSRFSRLLALSVSRLLSPSLSLSPGICLALPLVGLLAPSPLHLAHSTSTFRPSSHPFSLSSLLPSPSIVSLIFSIYSSSLRFPPEYNHPLWPPLHTFCLSLKIKFHEKCLQ